MKTALILHGICGHAGIHWQQWLHDELIKKGYKVMMPNLPDPNRPNRDKWLKTATKVTSKIDYSNLTIVGHSLGVVTALDLIEQSGKKVEKLFSVSGFAKDYGAELNSYFLKGKKINLKKVKKLVQNAYVIYGDNDPYIPQGILKHLADCLGANPIIIKNGGHLNTDSCYTKFPLLLDAFEKNE